MTRESLAVALILVAVGTASIFGVGPDPGGATGTDTGLSTTETTAGETTGDEMADGGTTAGETTGDEMTDGGTTAGETTGDGMADGGTTGDGTTAGGTTDRETATDTQRFVISTENIEECGRTCRDVTSALTNQQPTTAESVTVTTGLYAGKETDGDTLWEGSESIGTLGDGEYYTTTTRIKLSYGNAYAIKQENGWITIKTTVQTANQAVTFSEQRKVA